MADFVAPVKFDVEVLVPLDVEAAVVGWLRSLGVDAATQVPTDRKLGMVRVSRVGGEPIKDMVRDEPTVLIESWGSDQADSFDRIQYLFGLFMYAGKHQAIPSLGVTRCKPSPPATLEDYESRDVYRHQFTVSMTTQMGRMTV